MRSFETSSFTISERNTQDNVHSKIKITLTFIEDKSLILKIDKIRVEKIVLSIYTGKSNLLIESTESIKSTIKYILNKKKKIYFYFLVYKFLLVNIKLLLIK